MAFRRLESIEVSRQEVILLKPSLTIAELVGSQYYWIFHFHPVCLWAILHILKASHLKKNLLMN